MSKPFPVDKYPQVEADECVTKALNWFLNHIKVLVNYDETCYDFVCLWIAQMFQYPEHKSVELFFISSEGHAGFTGCERKSHGLHFCAKEHRSCVDGRATTRHLHGTTERAARCGTVKVPAESADAVSR